MAKNILLTCLSLLVFYIASVIVYDRNMPNYGCSFQEQIRFMNRILLLDFDRSSSLSRSSPENQKQVVMTSIRAYSDSAKIEGKKLIIYTSDKDNALMAASMSQAFCNENLTIIKETLIAYTPDDITLHHIKCLDRQD